VKKKVVIFLTATGEAGMFYVGAVIVLTLVTWFLSGIVNTLNLNGILHNLSLFVFVSGLFALTVFVFTILFIAVTNSKRFIDVFDRDSKEETCSSQEQ